MILVFAAFLATAAQAATPIETPTGKAAVRPVAVGATCSIARDSNSMTAFYPSSEKGELSVLVSGMSSSLLTLTFDRQPESKRIVIRIQGRENYVRTEGENIESIMDGYEGTASGALDTDLQKKDGVRRLHYKVIVTNSAAPVQIECALHEGESYVSGANVIVPGGAELRGPPIGVSLVSFTP